MTDGRIEVTCECGFSTTGDTDEVVATTQEHGRQVHNMDVTAEQVVAMSRPVAS